MLMPYRYIRHDSRNPFQWCYVAGMFGYGILMLSTDTFPGQIVKNTDAAFRYMWGVTFMVGAIFSLYGMICSVYYSKEGRYIKTPRGLAYEALGLYALGGTVGIYSASIFAALKFSNFFVAVMFACFSLAALFRGFQIHRGLTKVAKGEVSIADVEPTARR